MEKLRLIALVAFLAFSASIAYVGLFEKSGFALPTYDNSMLHTGRAREMIENGRWAFDELVFQGVTKSYHVQAYSALVASTSLLSGLSFIWAARLIAFLFVLLLPLSAYLLVLKLTGDWRPATAAALFLLISNGPMTWGTRTSAISFGVMLVPLLLYFVFTERRAIAFAGTIVIALTHPPSLLTYTLTLLVYSLFHFVKTWDRKLDVHSIIKSINWLVAAAGLLAFGTYMAWHVNVTGTSCLNFACLPQAGSHEYGAGVDLVKFFLDFPEGLALLGVLFLLFQKKQPQVMLLLAWFFASLVLVKNDALGIGVFTERFVTFLEMACTVTAAFAVKAALDFAEGKLAFDFPWTKK